MFTLGFWVIYIHFNVFELYNFCWPLIKSVKNHKIVFHSAEHMVNSPVPSLAHFGKVCFLIHALILDTTLVVLPI